jgi:hypothetical protein
MAGLLLSSWSPVEQGISRTEHLVWVIVATLVTALTCTALAAILVSQWWGLALYFWYAIPSNTFIHLPHEPATIYAPWLVVAVGRSLTTLFASIIDCCAIKKVFELRRVASVKQTRIYRMAVRWFRWKPWANIVFFAFTQIPFDAVRVLAPSSNCPLRKYVSANVIG